LTDSHLTDTHLIDKIFIHFYVFFVRLPKFHVSDNTLSDKQCVSQVGVGLLSVGLLSVGQLTHQTLNNLKFQYFKNSVRDTGCSICKAVVRNLFSVESQICIKTESRAKNFRFIEFFPKISQNFIQISTFLNY
jgi:hypothetical protein